jgi:hypothetical protein
LHFLIRVVAETAGPQFSFDWEQGWLRIPGVKSWGEELIDLKNRDVVARELVHTYGRCPFLYARTDPETGFPENALPMGPSGTACSTKVEALGNPEGYSFPYTAERSAGSAPFDRFTAFAQLNWQRVDRTFLFEVSLLSAAQKSLRAAHHEQLPPKFRSNTRLTEGVLCPEKSIR